MDRTIEHPCAGMSKAEMAAFDRIAAGGPHRSSTRTLASLMEAGLIDRHSVVVARDRLGHVVRYEYSVPVPMHIQWCEWMMRPKHRAKRKSAVQQLTADDLPLFSVPRSAR